MKYCCFLKSKDVLRGEVKRGRRLDCWPFMQFANSIVGWTLCSIELSCSHIDRSKTQVAFTTKTKHETIVDVHNVHCTLFRFEEKILESKLKDEIDILDIWSFFANSAVGLTERRDFLLG